MARKTIRTDRARGTFLEVLEATCNVSEACRRASISRCAAYAWREDEPAFAQQWAEAEEAAADKLEQVAFERATEGLSDRMLEILLKAHRPKYREKQAVELTGNVTVNHREAAEREVAEIFGGPTPFEITNG